jgi:hypothetical protein
MINRDDFIIKNNRKFFKATCDICGSDRGYKTPDHANRPCSRCNCIKANKVSIKARRFKPHVDKLCSIEGCNGVHHGQGYCEKHYNYLVRSRIVKNIDGTLTLKCAFCQKDFICNHVRKYCCDLCNIKAYRKRHPDSVKQSKTKYNINNPDKIKERHAKWRDNNKEKIKEYREVPTHKIAFNLRSRLSRAVKRDLKCGSAVKDLGCTIVELKKYLESKFLPGMSWDNYGTHGWHIDHIKPLNLFDLTNPEQLKEACHYSNLQPL